MASYRPVAPPTALDLDEHTEGVELSLSRISLVNGDREFMSAEFDNLEDATDWYNANCVENNWKLISWDAWS